MKDWIMADPFISSQSRFKLKNYQLRIRKFAPSGIAVHPDSKEYYILSSQGKTLVVVDDQNKIKHIEFLKSQHAQPEGICFDDQAKLYISNEARGLSPKIFMYTITTI
jgi:uncharacterized protein YjiK